MSLKMGELFAGYGGLGMGVQAVIPDAELAWVSEFDKGPSKILAHRFPGVPNHGDITKIDWSTVEPVDILTGGSPCQDLSTAGKRAGMTDGTRSNLWVAMREAIAELRPRYVIWENVRGAYSAQADSAVESCAGCVGDRRTDLLRALGRVLGDLSDLGYDCRWHGLRAADVGAPHGRFRVFAIATDARDVGHEWAGATRNGWTGSADSDRLADVKLLPTASARDYKDHTIRREPHRPDDVDTLARALTDVPCALLPTPMADDVRRDPAHVSARERVAQGHQPSLGGIINDLAADKLLPTPTVQHSARNSTAGRSPDAKPHADGDTLADLVFDGRLLPTPRAHEGGGNGPAEHGRNSPGLLCVDYHTEHWGDYAAAIARWEHVIGRRAPAPTMTSKKGNPQLSPVFVEWMMGLPQGWITDVPGVTRNEALKALGNGVVPQQAAEALREMLSWQVAA